MDPPSGCNAKLLLHPWMDKDLVDERGAARTVFNDPKHPYTRRLLRAARLDAVEPGQPIVLEDR